MPKDIQGQKPFSNQNISNEKPNAPRSKRVLTGWIGNSCNGGHNRPIAWKKIMAGEYHDEYRLKLNIKLLTPKTPTYQRLRATVRAFFVPNIRVWNNADKYTSQKGGASDIKIKEIPNLGGKIMPIVLSDTSQNTSDLMNTTIWRDAFISSYIPRMGQYIAPNEENRSTGITLPKINVLPLRGVVAIYNEYFRNKEYTAERTEYKGDTVSSAELANYIPDIQSPIDIDYYQLRAKRGNNYWTDYRTELQGFALENPFEEGRDGNDEFGLYWASFESKFAEMRSQAENAQLTDAQVIAKIRGSKLLTEGRVQQIGQREFTLNYSTITQSAYNTNEEIQEEFQVMGTQGAFSYTEINMPIYANQQFNEEGFVHIFLTISADSVFESGIDRMLMNITPLDEYRPDLEGDKLDVLYEYEFGTERSASSLNATFWQKIVGFKRKYSEYEKLPNVIGGDLCSKRYDEYIVNSAGYWDFQSELETQKTFQFFENDAAETFEYTSATDNKRIYYDYTDTLINKNLAIPFQVQQGISDYAQTTSTFIDGQNQIFFVGLHSCVATLPMNNGIENNKTQWGEH